MKHTFALELRGADQSAPGTPVLQLVTRCYLPVTCLTFSVSLRNVLIYTTYCLRESPTYPPEFEGCSPARIKNRLGGRTSRTSTGRIEKHESNIVQWCCGLSAYRPPGHRSIGTYERRHVFGKNSAAGHRQGQCIYVLDLSTCKLTSNSVTR